MQSRKKPSREEMFRSLGALSSVQTLVASLMDCRHDDLKFKSLVNSIINSVEEVKGVVEMAASKTKS